MLLGMGTTGNLVVCEHEMCSLYKVLWEVFLKGLAISLRTELAIVKDF